MFNDTYNQAVIQTMDSLNDVIDKGVLDSIQSGRFSYNTPGIPTPLHERLLNKWQEKSFSVSVSKDKYWTTLYISWFPEKDKVIE